MISARLKGPRKESYYQFILDTGAGTTVIDESVAISLGYNINKIADSQLLITAGSRITAKTVTLES
jgi:predicted aspartyl protease